MPGPLTQNISTTIHTTYSSQSNTYSGSTANTINNNVGTVVAAVTALPPSGSSFPSTAVTVTPSASNGSGISYSCSVNSGTIQSSPTSVVCTITVHAPSGGTLPSPLTIGVSLSFGSGEGGPG